MPNEMFLKEKEIPPFLKLTKEKIKEIVERKILKIKEYFKKSSFQKAILGVSGGLDSSLSALLTVKALGKNNVFLVFLPHSKITPSQNKFLIEKLAKNLNLTKKNLIEIEIGEIVEKEWQKLKKFSGKKEKLRKGNLIARERMKILFDLSLAKEAIVVGSENKTEYLLGYYTLWGDSASGIEPIKDLFKTEVYQIAKTQKEIPSQILKKAPSPDLWRGQKTEKELGLKIIEIDTILAAKERLALSEKQIEEKFKIKREKIEKVLKRIEIGKIKASLPKII
ncbi:NAD(+) synthase [Candidatus Parcubacteria bacterium]|nr:NAD(+) synthase [Candidatus Parcubacteria bacterium]